MTFTKDKYVSVYNFAEIVLKSSSDSQLKLEAEIIMDWCESALGRRLRHSRDRLNAGKFFHSECLSRSEDIR